METRKRRRDRIGRALSEFDNIQLMPRHKRQRRHIVPKKDVLSRGQVIQIGGAPFVRALARLRNQLTTETYGPAGDQCVRVHPEEFKKVKVEFAGAQAQYYRPYKIAWLAEHERWPNPGLECSHLCGSKECFNVSHLTEETCTRNHERRKCHNNLKRWTEDDQPDALKITYDTFFEDGTCGHDIECFIMIQHEPEDSPASNSDSEGSLLDFTIFRSPSKSPVQVRGKGGKREMDESDSD